MRSRLLKRDKGFAAAAILSLALGIGANTAIFQLLDAVRLRMLPVADPQRDGERVISRAGSSRSGRFSSRWPALTYAQVEEMRGNVSRPSAGCSRGAAACSTPRTAGKCKNVEALWASGDLFPVLGVNAAVGRLFTVEDDQRGCRRARWL